MSRLITVLIRVRTPKVAVRKKSFSVFFSSLLHTHCHTILLYSSGEGCNSALLSSHTIHSPFILLSFQQRFHPNIPFHHLIFISHSFTFIVFNCIRVYFCFMSLSSCPFKFVFVFFILFFRFPFLFLSFPFRLPRRGHFSNRSLVLVSSSWRYVLFDSSSTTTTITTHRKMYAC